MAILSVKSCRNILSEHCNVENVLNTLFQQLTYTRHGVIFLNKILCKLRIYKTTLQFRYFKEMFDSLPGCIHYSTGVHVTHR